MSVRAGAPDRIIDGQPVKVKRIGLVSMPSVIESDFFLLKKLPPDHSSAPKKFDLPGVKVDPEGGEWALALGVRAFLSELGLSIQVDTSNPLAVTRKISYDPDKEMWVDVKKIAFAVVRNPQEENDDEADEVVRKNSSMNLTWEGLASLRAKDFRDQFTFTALSIHDLRNISRERKDPQYPIGPYFEDLAKPHLELWECKPEIWEYMDRYSDY